jgi:hypothetical protein
MKSNITVLFELCIKAPTYIGASVDQNKSMKSVRVCSNREWEELAKTGNTLLASSFAYVTKL